MLSHCEKISISKEFLFSGRLVSEYSFTNKTKMMGHVWDRNDEIIIAAKGSPERILTICKLSEVERKQAEDKIIEMSKQGLRVIAVGEMRVSNESALHIPPRVRRSAKNGFV